MKAHNDRDRPHDVVVVRPPATALASGGPAPLAGVCRLHCHRLFVAPCGRDDTVCPGQAVNEFGQDLVGALQLSEVGDLVRLRRVHPGGEHDFQLLCGPFARKSCIPLASKGAGVSKAYLA